MGASHLIGPAPLFAVIPLPVMAGTTAVYRHSSGPRRAGCMTGQPRSHARPAPLHLEGLGKLLSARLQVMRPKQRKKILTRLCDVLKNQTLLRQLMQRYRCQLGQAMVSSDECVGFQLSQYRRGSEGSRPMSYVSASSALPALRWRCTSARSVSNSVTSTSGYCLRKLDSSRGA